MKFSTALLVASVMGLAMISGCAISTMSVSNKFPKSHAPILSRWTAQNIETREQPNRERLNRIQFVDENEEPIEWADVWIYTERPTGTLKNATSYELTSTDLLLTDEAGTVTWPRASLRLDGGVKDEESMHCVIGFSHESFGISLFSFELPDVIGSRLIVRDQRTSAGIHFEAAAEAIQDSGKIRVGKFRVGEVPKRVLAMWNLADDENLAPSRHPRPDWVLARQNQPRNFPEKNTPPALPNNATNIWAVRLSGRPIAGHLIVVTKSGWPTLYISDAWGRVQLTDTFDASSANDASKSKVYFLYDGDMHLCHRTTENGNQILNVLL